VWGDGGDYAAWTSYLQRWQADLRTADEPLPALRSEDFAPQTWVRLTNHIIDAINGRLRAWTDAFMADVGAARSEFAFSRALVGARTGLASVLRLADHASLPEDLRGQLRGQVERQIRSMQQTLEQDTAGLEREGWSRADAEVRRRSVRESPLTAVLTAPTPPPAPDSGPAENTPDPWAFDPSQRPRRRLVID
jgi:hypothetical protein